MVDMSIALAKLGRVEDCVADDDSAVLTEVRPTAESGGSCQASIHSTITDDSVDMTLWPIVATALQEVQIYALTDGGAEAVASFGRQMIAEHGLEDNFYAYDLSRLCLLHQAFATAMPRVRPFYAVKCNPDPVMLRTLAALGCGFDCASAAEVNVVLAAGAAPGDIIMAQACKRPVDLRAAVASGLQLMTFDCEDELFKVAAACPRAHLVLRIRADDATAEVPLGNKFGADAEVEAHALLASADRLGLRVVGVAFHVGSGSHTAAAYAHGIRLARQVFAAAATMGMQLWLLDIGGGFWGRFGTDGRVLMGDVAEEITVELERCFPAAEWAGLRVIAEPGRFFGESCGTLFSLVHTAKTCPGGEQQYFITDGLYGSFAAVGSGRLGVGARILRGPNLEPPSDAETSARVPSAVFGPTCDGWDRIMHDVPMPLLRRGDWLQFPDFGAYRVALASGFNGISVGDTAKFYVWSERPVGPYEAGKVVLRKGWCGDGGAGPVGEELLCLVATPQDLGTAAG